MKPLMLLGLVLTLTGCATLDGLPSGQAAAQSPVEVAPSFDAPASPPLPSAMDLSPRVVIPATGGGPVIGIPLGGGVFLPVTGGTPIIGTSTIP